jgi:hypothetical protein
VFSAIVAALALAGAPAATPVTCSPVGLVQADGSATTALALTRLHATPVRVDLLGPAVCGGLLYASASPRERAALRRLNPRVAFVRLEGVGLLVMLHEAQHVALGSADECRAEAAAMAELPALVAQLVAEPERAAVLAIARASDAQLPAAYHGC